MPDSDHEVIYLAPPCHGDERMWCEDSGVVDCECMDGPHPWIKFVRQPPSDAIREAKSSIEFHQRRGMLTDTVDWAVLEYEEFMKDDAYDAQAVLDRIISRLREVNAALTQGKPDAFDKWADGLGD